DFDATRGFANVAGAKVGLDVGHIINDVVV
ncbi:MAG: hypothetical protein RLZZ292_3107, partial [Bacteroidota bacterium]